MLKSRAKAGGCKAPRSSARQGRSLNVYKPNKLCLKSQAEEPAKKSKQASGTSSPARTARPTRQTYLSASTGMQGLFFCRDVVASSLPNYTAAFMFMYVVMFACMHACMHVCATCISMCLHTVVLLFGTISVAIC